MFNIVNPRQTVLVTSRGRAKNIGMEQQRDNVMALDWHMPVSFEPFLYSIAVGKTRFSLRLIRQSGVFVVNFVPYHLKEHAVFCGRHSGEHVDKFAQVEKEEADSIDCPRLKHAVAFLECQVVDKRETGDHVVLTGRVINSKLVSGTRRLFHLANNDFDSL